MDTILLKLARDAIKSKFEHITIDKENLIKQHPFLKDDRATFVTLTIDGNLRGCIGSIIPHRKLIDDIIHNAISAGFEDPRFYPLTKEEFEKIHIEVSILTIPSKVEYKNVHELKELIKPSIHGVIIKKDFYQATFLPQVWEQLPTFELFFSHLCQKARLNQNCLESNPDIYLYEVEKIEE